MAQTRIPAAVQRQADEAEAKLKALKEGKPSGEPEKPEPSPPKAEPEKPKTSGKKTEDTADYWRDRFNVVQGFLEQANRRAMDQQDEFKRQSEALSQQVQELTKKLQAIEDKPKEEARNELFDQVDMEVADLVRDRDRHYESRIAALQAEIVDLKSNAESTGKRMQETDEQRFWREFEREVPDYRQINVDPAFGQWMDEVPEGLSAYMDEAKTRNQLLHEAHKRLDVERCIKIYKEWQRVKAEKGQGGSSPAELEEQLQPAAGAGQGAGEEQIVKGRIWTKADVEQLKKDVRSKRYRGREQELDELMNDLQKAYAEGRYRDR